MIFLIYHHVRAPMWRVGIGTSAAQTQQVLGLFLSSASCTSLAPFFPSQWHSLTWGERGVGSLHFTLPGNFRGLGHGSKLWAAV